MHTEHLKTKTLHKLTGPKIFVVIGPTASGKSELAVKLAKKYKGEVISADSRQVYKGLNIGTGKVEGQWVGVQNKKSKVKTTTHNLKIAKLKIKNSPVFIYKGIPHHCIDFVSPKRQYTVSDFKRDGTKAIKDILTRGKTPIICGGTGQYVDALILNSPIPEVPPDPKFRKLMEKKTTSELYAILQKKDPTRASTIDPHNPRRLIRALEIIHTTGKPIPPLTNEANIFSITINDKYAQLETKSAVAFLSSIVLMTEEAQEGKPVPINHINNLTFKQFNNKSKSKPTSLNRQFPISNYSAKGGPASGGQFSIYYLNPPCEQLYKKIEKRFDGWLKEGLLQEVLKLHAGGVSWKRLEEFGLEYRYVSQYLKNSSRDLKIRNWKLEIRHFLSSPYYPLAIKSIKDYAKRQQTWFKKYSS